jgi:hypothetical protein
MTQMMPERRSRPRTQCRNDMELVLPGARASAQLLNITFAGIQGRVAPGTAAPLDALEAVNIEGLPSLPVTVRWQNGDLFGATFDAPTDAGPVIAGFLELFVPPADAPPGPAPA